jgi:hypothetical protein
MVIILVAPNKLSKFPPRLGVLSEQAIFQIAFPTAQ